MTKKEIKLKKEVDSVKECFKCAKFFECKLKPDPSAPCVLFVERKDGNAK